MTYSFTEFGFQVRPFDSWVPRNGVKRHTKVESFAGAVANKCDFASQQGREKAPVGEVRAKTVAAVQS
jgi:hypothetical protein